MKVELLDYTQDALELLLYTKDTRLQGEQSIQDIKEWSDEKKQEHFAYMLDTIQSSFEFVNYTFKISGVPRSFTHQFVRTRTGSYAQESQRTVDVREAGCEYPDKAEPIIQQVFTEYGLLIDEGMPIQEAREILPIGVHTSIIAKFDLRTLHDMALVRLCTRTAGMYQNVFKEIKRLVVETHPWAEDFIQVHCSWYGTCAFPRYEECPIQGYTINKVVPDLLQFSKENCRREIELTDHVANPVANNGMSMSTTAEQIGMVDEYGVLIAADCSNCIFQNSSDDCDEISISIGIRQPCSKFEDDGIPF